MSNAYKLTELGNAERMAETCADRLRYVADWKTWLRWDGRRWRRDNAGAGMAAAKEVTRELFAEAADLSKKAAAGDEAAADAAAALVRWARSSSKASTIKATAELAKTEPPLAAAAGDFDTDPWLLNVGNGTVDLRTGELRPHDRSDMITQLAPVAFDPAAEAPRWDAFLKQMLPDPDVRTWVQRFIGHCLTGDVGEQILTFLWGGGDNGKSTLLGAVQDLLGDYAFQGPPGLLLSQDRGEELGRRQRASLLGRRLVVVQEVSPGKYLNETQVKQITGGDKISAARLYENEIEFSPTHKIIVAANHKPVVRGQDHAIWRRIRLVPFTVKIGADEKDPELPDKLAAEAPGILAWAIDGCLAWQRDGLRPPEAIKVATATYRDDEDRLADFIGEWTTRDADAWVPLAELHAKYRQWCGRRDEKPWSNKALRAALEERGFNSRRVKGRREIGGLRIDRGGEP